MSIFMSVFGVVLLLLLGLIHNWHSAIFTTIAFFSGVITSVVCGFIGMRVGKCTAATAAFRMICQT
jgi:Na+/H+-translocating membrane pyrophosphatase